MNDSVKLKYLVNHAISDYNPDLFTEAALGIQIRLLFDFELNNYVHLVYHHVVKPVLNWRSSYIYFLDM